MDNPLSPVTVATFILPKALRLSTQDHVLQIKSYYRSEVSWFGERNKRHLDVSFEVKLVIL